MRIVYGISWNDSKRGRLTGITLAMLVALSLFCATSETVPLPSFGGPTVSVIVRELPSAGGSTEQLVQDLGGKVGRKLGVIDGFVADVPASQLERLRSSEGVRSVTLDARVQMLANPGHVPLKRQPGSITNIGVGLGADRFWDSGVTGEGVDVALIDSGVVPVNGLRQPGHVVNGADVSFESGAPHLRYLDTYGHGTHMAGIIAGHDDGVSPSNYGRGHNFMGIAPDARIINVKAANALGAADVSQVIAAIDWVIQHRNDNGMNIRVLNLSFGTDGVQDYLLDPLAYAAEVAWHKGIVVVVAAGNRGFGTAKLNNPAYDPYVIAVGAVDSRGTSTVDDDRVPGWSSRGDGTRNPDLVAPGKSIVSLRAPGSYIDQMHPEGVVNDRFFKGSGTSQAAAVVSGAAALLLDARPGLTPDQVKGLLMATARVVPNSSQVAQGAGLIDPVGAAMRSGPVVDQIYPRSTGLGSLEAARGSAHVVVEGREVIGEVDVFGNSWSGNSWSGNSWSGNSWSGGSWSGNSWSGNSWSGGTWLGNSWSGNSWSGNSWSGNSWSGNSWSGNSWSGNSWSGNSWSGNSWSGNSWSGNSWSGNSWSANGWE